MKMNLYLTKTIVIDTADIDPNLITEAIQDLDLFTDENGDELKLAKDLEDGEWKDVVEKLLEDDIDTVCDVRDEIDAADFVIERVHDEPEPAA